METDEIRRLESAIANLEYHVSDLRRAVNPMADLLRGAQPQTVQTPSGIPGFNKQWQIPAVTLGDVPADEGGVGGTFLGSYDDEADELTIGPGSYQFPLGTNTDVTEETTGTGKFAYAVIKQDAVGGLVEFKIEITGDTKDPTNRDAADEFVEWSNVLLGEVMSVPGEDGEDGTTEFIQRRTGNLSLIRRIINGNFCLWPETTGGSSL